MQSGPSGDTWGFKVNSVKKAKSKSIGTSIKEVTSNLTQVFHFVQNHITITPTG
jgi:hypothetical protein